MVTYSRFLGSNDQPEDQRTVGRRYQTARPQRLEVGIETGLDDVEERTRSTGQPRLQRYSGDLDIQSGVRVGLRFSGLEIPRDAEILSAHVELVSDENRSGSLAVSIQAEAADDASVFSKQFPITGRTLTTESVKWTIGQAWSRGELKSTPELAPLVQEIVVRPGWSSGNALVLILDHEGGEKRAAESVEGDGAAARLVVEFIP